MLGKRGIALGLGTVILNNRLRDRLRHQRSLAYEVNASYQRLNSEIAEITAFADSLAANARDAAAAIIDTVKELASSGPTPEELQSIVIEMRRSKEHPDAPFARLDQTALEVLEGLEQKTDAERDAEAESVTPQEVAGAFAEAFPTSYLSVPNEVSMAFDGFSPVPLSVGKRIKGIQVLPMPGSGHADVIDFSTDGISLVLAQGLNTIGMKWNEVAAALWWNDGKRTLIAQDGASIIVEAGRWRHVEPLLEAIHKNVPADRWIPMDEPGSLPRQVGKVCSVCESSPAIEVTLQMLQSMIMWRLRRVHGIFCRDCGIAKFREVQRDVLLRGWWSIPGVVVTPFVLLGNLFVWLRFRRLPLPIHTSGITPLRQGRTVWLFPGMLIPLALVLFLVWVFRPQ